MSDQCTHLSHASFLAVRFTGAVTLELCISFLGQRASTTTSLENGPYDPEPRHLVAHFVDPRVSTRASVPRRRDEMKLISDAVECPTLSSWPIAESGPKLHFTRSSITETLYRTSS